MGPKIDLKDSFKLKGQFLKELRDNTFSGLDNEDVKEHIKKILEVVDLFHISNITIDQVMLRAFPMSLTRSEVVLFYNRLDVPTRQILDSRGAIPSKTAADAKVAIKKWLNTLKNGATISVMPLSTYLNLGLGELAHTKLTAKLADRTVKYPKGIVENVIVVLEDMDAFHDDGIGDVILGELFLREVRINEKWYERNITIHNGNEEVTYQMVRPHPRFKHHTNEQCNKIPPLLKVSEEDKMNGISHSYQKLKGFYKGVLNLGPEYVRDAKMEE
nr:hypothetical protein [Tanacetum cinerariifolium]